MTETLRALPRREEHVHAPTRDVADTTPTPLEMRQAMGNFATGVAVVTGADDGGPVGFACQSFASVSLEPPLVLFCASHNGRAWPRIRKAGRFCVNVLGDQQTDVCDRFGSIRGRKYDGLEWDLSRWGTPALRDVLLRLHAEVHQVHAAGDHDVVIGRVLELERGSDQRPMIYFRGSFGIEPGQATPLPWVLEPREWGERWG